MDASALVAILTVESDYKELADQADQASELITSAIARWEVGRALERLYPLQLDRAFADLERLLTSYAVKTVVVGEQEANLALEAHRFYGKGNHPARLNMGDCFAYACAKANSAKLLYKGDDFALTDLA
jgi:ribonuclease VapC